MPVRLSDFEDDGYAVFQDHSDPARPIQTRFLRGAARFTGYDEYGRPVGEDETSGDILGHTLWPLDKGVPDTISGSAAQRACPGWSGAWPAVVTSAPSSSDTDPEPIVFGPNSGGPFAGEPGLLGFGEDALGGFGIPGTTDDQGRRTTKAQKVARCRPVHTSRFGADTRFKEKAVALPPWTPRLPKGTPLIVIGATDEDAQVELGFATGYANLVAVNKDPKADPGLATIVYDLNENNELDVNRSARLHSAFRVVRPKPGGCFKALAPKDPPESHAIALQWGAAGRDSIAGFGLVYDPEGYSTVPDERKEPEKPDYAIAVFGGMPVLNTTNASGYYILVPPPIVPAKEIIHFGTGTREKPGTGSDPTATTAQRKKTGTVGALSSLASGPLLVNPPGCQHKLGVTLDGEDIYSAHLRVGAYWSGPAGEGPLAFEPVRCLNPKGAPLLTRGHIRFDPEAPHDHVCGQKKGMYKIECEAYDQTWTPRQPPQIVGDDGNGASFIGDPGTVPPPIGGGKPKVPQSYRKSLNTMVVHSLAFQALPVRRGGFDPRAIGPVSQAQLDELSDAPVVAQMTVFGATRGEADEGGFDRTNEPGSCNWPGGSGDGLIWWSGPETDPTTTWLGDDPGAADTSTVTIGIDTGMHWGGGKPTKKGKLKKGAIWGTDVDGDYHVHTTDDNGEIAGTAIETDRATSKIFHFGDQAVDVGGAGSGTVPTADGAGGYTWTTPTGGAFVKSGSSAIYSTSGIGITLLSNAATGSADPQDLKTRAGSGTDGAGSNFRIVAGVGTGAGTPGGLYLKVGQKTASGTTPQAQRVRFELSNLDTILYEADGSTPIFSVDVTAGTPKLGFFNTARIGQQTVAALTDSSGGSAGGTIAAAGGSYSQSNENDFRASITAKVNATLAAFSAAAGGFGLLA